MPLRRHLAALYPELRLYAHSLARDPARAEDLAGDAVVRALSAPGAPGTPERLRPWLFRVIRNLHVDDWRARRVRADHAASVGHLLQGAATPARAEDDALGRRALAGLSAPHREVLMLVDGLGLSYAEAAAAIGVPRGTVMSRLARARAAMIARVDGADTRGEDRGEDEQGDDAAGGEERGNACHGG